MTDTEQVLATVLSWPEGKRAWTKNQTAVLHLVELAVTPNRPTPQKFLDSLNEIAEKGRVSFKNRLTKADKFHARALGIRL
jgi:hypothetical protein